MNVFKEEMNMQDKIEIIGTNSTIQHGEHNKRIYLIKLDEQDVGSITSLLTLLARERGYSKIFCKVPAWAAPVFNADGFIMEAFIPGFFFGTEGVCFMSKFLNSDRLLGIDNHALMQFSRILKTHATIEGVAASRAGNETAVREKMAVEEDVLAGERVAGAEKPGIRMSGYDRGKSQDDHGVSALEEKDADAITEVYKKVFRSYPFPIHDPNYIRKTMRDHIRYFGIREREALVALSSAEMDPAAKNAEMTDFATLPKARGKGAAYHLLGAMEKEMKTEGIKTLYTIARLNSLPMNKTFLKHGYEYSGTLINNTNIAGNIESMNVLYKHVN
ncbi:MAG: putative beta-lysine N-acetyltransferase [Bacteroidales bacterium]|nr:putative beta-lysine N-acetyltransferase [Bacteroidales bacterium]MDT8430454.1 putative beta-lysine N-acetyltransferase [Bacteroidales bacterium]